MLLDKGRSVVVNSLVFGVENCDADVVVHYETKQRSASRTTRASDVVVVLL